MSSSLGYWCDSGEGSLKPTPTPKRDERIRSLYGAISPGTERLVGQGKVPEKAFEKMRCQYMQGEFSSSAFYGYSVVGVTKTQQPVFVMHPHQEEFYADNSALTLLGPKTDLKRATLIPNLETALNAVWDSQVAPGDHVLVVGGGIVGSLISYICSQIPGCTVQLVDLDRQKRALLNQLNWDVEVVSTDSCKESHKVFHCSSSSSGLQLAIDQAKPESRVIEVSWFGGQSVELDLGDAFHYGRLQIRSSQVSVVALQRFTHKTRMEAVLRLLADERWDQFISHEISFDQLPEFMSSLYKNEIPCLSVLIKYGGD